MVQSTTKGVRISYPKMDPLLSSLMTIGAEELAHGMVQAWVAQKLLNSLTTNGAHRRQH